MKKIKLLPMLGFIAATLLSTSHFAMSSLASSSDDLESQMPVSVRRMIATGCGKLSNMEPVFGCLIKVAPKDYFKGVKSFSDFKVKMCGLSGVVSGDRLSALERALAALELERDSARLSVVSLRSERDNLRDVLLPQARREGFIAAQDAELQALADAIIDAGGTVPVLALLGNRSNFDAVRTAHITELKLVDLAAARESARIAAQDAELQALADAITGAGGTVPALALLGNRSNFDAVRTAHITELKLVDLAAARESARIAAQDAELQALADAITGAGGTVPVLALLGNRSNFDAVRTAHITELKLVDLAAARESARIAAQDAELQALADAITGAGGTVPVLALLGNRSNFDAVRTAHITELKLVDIAGAEAAATILAQDAELRALADAIRGAGGTVPVLALLGNRSNFVAVRTARIDALKLVDIAGAEAAATILAQDAELQALADAITGAGGTVPVLALLGNRSNFDLVRTARIDALKLVNIAGAEAAARLAATIAAQDAELQALADAITGAGGTVPVLALLGNRSNFVAVRTARIDALKLVDIAGAEAAARLAATRAAQTKELAVIRAKIMELDGGFDLATLHTVDDITEDRSFSNIEEQHLEVLKRIQLAAQTAHMFGVLREKMTDDRIETPEGEPTVESYYDAISGKFTARIDALKSTVRKYRWGIAVGLTAGYVICDAYYKVTSLTGMCDAMNTDGFPGIPDHQACQGTLDAIAYMMGIRY